MTALDLPDGEYTAVVDSIEDGLATVFFEQDGEDVGNTVLPVDQLPDEGQQADAMLSVSIIDGTIDNARYDAERTVKRADAAQKRFNRLSRRPPSEDGT